MVPFASNYPLQPLALPDFNALTAALVDRYQILRELGRGGFAVVYLARDLRHDRSVALKVLHEEVAASLGEERFEREIKLAARLQHPHILGVFDSGVVGKRLWFTMPFIEGESLRDRMKRERQLPVADAVSITREVADALHYAHQHGVIHRDVKPENILLSGRHAIVADFGIARAIGGEQSNMTQTGVTIGSPGYMSPEQASGEKDLDARTDVFSLGCVLYEMLAGEAPFDGANYQSIVARLLTEQPRPIHSIRPGVSEALDAIIACALAKVPADRYGSAEQFADALSQTLTTISATVPAPVATKRTGRRPSAMFTMFALGLILGIGSLFAWMSNRGDNAAGKGLAVLPFENMGAAEDANFADGITEEVRGKLTGVPGLRVTARTSSNQYRGSTKTSQQIGHDLGVRYILTGTVRWDKASDGQRRVRVTPELINTADGSTAWQEPFDEVMSDVFKVQSAIAEKVASTLGMTLASEERDRLARTLTSNVEAYQEFLQGEHATQSMSRTDGLSLRNALPHYERAVALDSTFGVAWARVSFVTSETFSTNPTEELARRAEETALRALRLAPDDPQTRRAYSRYFRSVRKDYAASLAQIDTGLLRQPNNADLLSTASGLNALLGRWDAAVDLAKRAHALDPLNVSAVANVVRVLHGTRHFADADGYSLKALALSPGNISIIFNRALNQVSMGDLPAAKQTVREGLQHADTTALASYFALYQEMMWLLDEPLLRRITQMTPAQFLNNRQQWALKVGRTWLLLGDTLKGRAYGDTSRIAIEGQLASFPEDAQLHELRGRALALMGRGPEAIEEAERSLKMRETALDLTTGPYIKYQVARILVQAGAYDRALDIIEPLLTTMYADITPAWLRLEPVFYPLRGNPRFERLTKQ